MKYHSVYWWFFAFYYQIKHIVRNIICRKILRIKFGYTIPDLLTLFVQNNSNFLYQIITHKYPELTYLRKYIGTGYESTVTDYICAGIYVLYKKSVTTLWTEYGNINDIIFLLEIGIPVNVIMENTLGVNHAVLVVGLNDEKGNDEIIFNDPLGDPWTRYKMVYGFKIVYKKENFLRATGNNIKLSITVKSSDSTKIEKIKNNFLGRKIFILEK
jgi:hypothetical protein